MKDITDWRLNMHEITPWELLLKTMIWNQISFIKNKRVLDFGSGIGLTANHLAADNIVTAIEPNKDSVNGRITENTYKQLIGSIDCLYELESESFDAILCHNVLEYIPDHERYFKEFERILKPNGTFSLIKHNRNGRVIQMTVLLNNFEHANELLDNKPGNSEQYGAIQYYDNDEIMNYTTTFHLKQMYGIRHFWHLQQNQEIQRDTDWQKNMIDIETRVSILPDYQSFAFFHHLLFKKQK